MVKLGEIILLVKLNALALVPGWYSLYHSVVFDLSLVDTAAVLYGYRMFVDEYLKRSGMALSGDYSPEYLKRKREEREKAQSDEIRADFVQLYRKAIWNE